MLVEAIERDYPRHPTRHVSRWRARMARQVRPQQVLDLLTKSVVESLVLRGRGDALDGAHCDERGEVEIRHSELGTVRFEDQSGDDRCRLAEIFSADSQLIGISAPFRGRSNRSTRVLTA